MGTKYSSTLPTGYNSNPPADDGSQVASNKVKYSTIKSKLADPLHTYASALDTVLQAAFDTSSSITSVDYTTVASDHLKPIEVSGTATISLGDAATMGAGYQVIIINAGNGIVTVGVATDTDTVDGVADDSLKIPSGASAIFAVNNGADGYRSITSLFKQSGTGVVSRAIRDKLRDIVSVKDFGATGDGTTDDTTAIQAAFDAVKVAGGGVFFPAGTYRITSQLSLASAIGVSLYGECAGAGSIASSQLAFDFTGSDAALTFKSSSDCSMHDLLVTASNTLFTGDVIDLTGTTLSPAGGFDMRNCFIFGNSTNQSPNSAVNLDKAVSSTFYHCLFFSCHIGVIGLSASGSFSNQIAFIGCEFSGNGSANVNEPGASWSLIGCTFEALAAGAPGSIGSTIAPQAILISGCWFGDATATGTWISLSNAKGAEINANFIAGNGTDTVDGVEINTGCSGVSIHGNLFYECTVGINVVNSVSDFAAFANSFDSCTTDISGLSNVSGLSSSGSRKLPDGTLEQWGSADISTTQTDITYPTAYSTLLTASISFVGLSVQGATPRASKPTTTGFNSITVSGTATVMWRVVGIV